MEEEITIDTTEAQKIVRDYSEQLHGNKLDNLDEMDKLPEIYLVRLDSQAAACKVHNMSSGKKL